MADRNGKGLMPQGAVLARVRGILADLVREAGKHAHDHPVGRLDAGEGELECLLDRPLVPAQPAGGQEFERQARFGHLADRGGHFQGIGLEEGFADGHLAELFLHFLAGPGEVIERAHEEVVLPAFVHDALDRVRTMGGDARQDPPILDLLDVVAHVPGFAGTERPLGHPAVMDHADRFGLLDDRFDRGVVAWPLGMQADGLQARPLFPQFPQRFHGLRRVIVLPSGDAVAEAVLQQRDGPFHSEPLAHGQ